MEEKEGDDEENLRRRKMEGRSEEEGKKEGTNDRSKEMEGSKPSKEKYRKCIRSK